MVLAKNDQSIAELTDQALIEGIISGDRNSFDKLYERYVGKIRSILVRLGDAKQIDDMTQETFIRIWRNLEKVRSTQCISAWVYRVSVNVAYDSLRSAQKWRTEELFEETVSSIDEVSAIENRNLVRVALECLEFSHRAVIVLHDLEELTETEISSALDIPVGTVKSRLFHARSKLRAFFKENRISL